LVAEIARLLKAKMKSVSDAAFGGWSREEEAAHKKHSERLAVLVRELEAIERTQE